MVRHLQSCNEPAYRRPSSKLLTPSSSSQELSWFPQHAFKAVLQKGGRRGLGQTVALSMGSLVGDLGHLSLQLGFDTVRVITYEEFCARINTTTVSLNAITPPR
jgi:hypothetical protein